MKTRVRKEKRAGYRHFTYVVESKDDDSTDWKVVLFHGEKWHTRDNAKMYKERLDRGA
jgi:hypothetical protein